MLDVYFAIRLVESLSSGNQPKPSMHVHGSKTRFSGEKARPTSPFPLLNHRIHTVYGVDTKLLLVISTMLPVTTSLMAPSRGLALISTWPVPRLAYIWIALVITKALLRGPHPLACSKVQQLLRSHLCNKALAMPHRLEPPKYPSPTSPLLHSFECKLEVLRISFEDWDARMRSRTYTLRRVIKYV